MSSTPSDELHSSHPEAYASAVQILSEMRCKGVELWLENGQLRYKAPRGALTRKDIEELRSSRDGIRALLEGSGTDIPQPQAGPMARRAPLSFSQLAHWNLYQLADERSLRQIASATRLVGSLNVEALERSLSELARRHEALRTRIALCDGIPMQEVTTHGTQRILFEDLTSIPEEHREGAVLRQIERQILEPVSLTTEPLLAGRLLKLRANEHVLILAMEHIIGDLFSMGVLLRHLLTAYAQTARGTAFALPDVPVQFPDYALLQQRTRDAWLEKHGAYWDERLKGAQRLRLAGTCPPIDAGRRGWGTVSLRISKALRQDLREWCRVHRATLAIGVFTTYVALVLRWCNASQTLIRFQSDGRRTLAVESSIGYFASALYLRLELRECDSFIDLLNRVTEEYCQAYEHADFSYFESQLPRPEFTRNTLFNWVPDGPHLEYDAPPEGDSALTCSPISFDHPMLKDLHLDHEPILLLFDAGEEIVGGIHFPLSHVPVAAMERFGGNLTAFLETMVRAPDRCVMQLPLR